MKIKVTTRKFLKLRDYFNIFWYLDNEADLSFNLTLFGREFSWDFYKKDSNWIGHYYDDEFDPEFDSEQV